MLAPEKAFDISDRSDIPGSDGFRPKPETARADAQCRQDLLNGTLALKNLSLAMFFPEQSSSSPFLALQGAASRRHCAYSQALAASARFAGRPQSMHECGWQAGTRRGYVFQEPTSDAVGDCIR